MTARTERPDWFFTPLAVRIREAAGRLGLNQSDLGRALDVHRSTTKRWWTGLSTPDRDDLIKLEQLLELGPGELRYLAGFLPGDDPRIERDEDGSIIIRLSPPISTMRP